MTDLKLRWSSVRSVVAAFALSITIMAGAASVMAAPAGSRFALAGETIVRDRDAGLEWTREDNGHDVDWADAAEFCRSLSPGTWQLPTTRQLVALADADKRDHSDCSVNGAKFTCLVPALFRLSSPAHWTRDPAPDRGPILQAWTVHLIENKPVYDPVTQRGHQRAMCVRTTRQSRSKPRRHQS